VHSTAISQHELLTPSDFFLIVHSNIMQNLNLSLVDITAFTFVNTSGGQNHMIKTRANLCMMTQQKIRGIEICTLSKRTKYTVYTLGARNTKITSK